MNKGDIGFRPWSTLTTKEQEYLATGAGILTERCRKVGAYYSSAYNALERHRRLPKQGFVQPAPDTPIYSGDHIKISGSALILADPHAPYYDDALVNRAIGLATAWGITNCLVAGDVFEFAAYSPFRPDIPASKPSYDLASGQSLIGELARNFRVYVILGNHDGRILQTMYNQGMGWEDIRNLLAFPPEVTLSDYHWCEVWSNKPHMGDICWRVTHPDRYSKARGLQIAVANNCNIMMAHSHYCGITHHPDGKHTIIETGGVFHPRKLAYVCKKDSGQPRFCQGFAIICCGVGYLFDPLNVDWSVWDHAISGPGQDGLCQEGNAVGGAEDSSLPPEGVVPLPGADSECSRGPEVYQQTWT